MKQNVFVVGYSGKMGKIVCDLIKRSNDLEVTQGYDLVSDSELGITNSHNMPIIWTNAPNVIVDFSKPEATMRILPYAVRYHVPMVIATTGFSGEHEALIEDAAKTIPIFRSTNMSYGAKAFVQIVQLAVKLFQPPYEISIHEKHHSGKADAPSGTAKTLFEAINDARGNTLIYRFDSNGKRNPNEVWVSAERVGAFRGEHIVTIAGENDYVELKHFVNDRGVFAEGALQAARFIMRQTEPRIYTMDDLFNE